MENTIPNEVGTPVLENESVSDSVVYLELYREYATNEINLGNDFLTFTEWKELSGVNV
jgi:hypothetical protein